MGDGEKWYILGHPGPGTYETRAPGPKTVVDPSHPPYIPLVPHGLHHGHKLEQIHFSWERSNTKHSTGPFHALFTQPRVY